MTLKAPAPPGSSGGTRRSLVALLCTEGVFCLYLNQVPISSNPWTFHGSVSYMYSILLLPLPPPPKKKLLGRKWLKVNSFNFPYYSRIFNLMQKKYILGAPLNLCNIRLPRLSISLLFMSSSFWYISCSFGALYLVTSIMWLKTGLVVLNLWRTRSNFKASEGWFSTISQRASLQAGLLFEMSFLWCKCTNWQKFRSCHYS